MRHFGILISAIEVERLTHLADGFGRTIGQGAVVACAAQIGRGGAGCRGMT